MKSEKAKEYITHATCTAQEYAERFGGRELVVSRWDVSTAIELAEQDAEERMQEKAIKAFEDVLFMPAKQLAEECAVSIDSVREDAGVGHCRQLFIQKLNENENN